ncbi:MAG TPA: hypothetical protein VGM63_09245 [Mucilaginibacter sp.]|jgi:hypothetical protein
MLKRLLIFLIFLSVFTAAKSQTNTDSTKHSPIDTTVKHSVADTTAKHLESDSSAKHSATKKKESPNEVVFQHSPIKTISDTRYNAYLRGDDLDSLALAGQLNQYPLPDDALKYKVQLSLNVQQVAKLKDLATTLHRKKVEMGESIIRNEKMLDNLFHNQQITDGNLIFYTNRSGLYYGELKGAILMACYNTQKILSEGQLKKLVTLEKMN